MGLFKTPEELRKMGWMPQDEASKLLGLPLGEMISWDFIDSEQTASDGENWVLLLPGVGGRESGVGDGEKTENEKRKPDSDSNVKCKVSNAKCKVGRTKRKPADPTLFGERERVPSSRSRWGEREILISVEEAAGRLGWSVRWTKKHLGIHIEARWVKGERRVVLQSVEWWLAAHAEQSARRKAEREARKREKAPGGFSGAELSIINDQLSIINEEAPPAEERWILVREAAGVLGVTAASVKRMIWAGKLGARRRGSRTWEVSLAAVVEMADRREREMLARCIPAKEWEYDRLRPYFRTKLEAPPGDRLISRPEAARMLDVHPCTVTRLILKGTLFAWQSEPGKKGSLVFLSYNQVLRYSERPDRRLRRQRYEEANAQSRGEERGRVAGYEEVGIPEYDLYERTGNALIDHGEYYSTRQVALLLGISVEAVRAMVKRRRLVGYRRPLEKNRYERRRWWFYRKEDVHALIHDPVRRKWVESYRKAQTPEARAEREARRIREFYR